VLSADPLFEFRLRLERCPAKPSRPAATGRLLSWAFGPYSTSRPKGPLRAGFPCPLRSALRVSLPSRRFPPFGPLPVLFHTGGAPGLPPSKLSPLERYPHVSVRKDPRTVSPGVLPATEIPGRPAGPRFLGFGPLKSPSPSEARLTLRSPGAPLGFPLPGFSSGGLVRVFTRISSPALGVAASRIRFCLRLRVSIGLRLVRSTTRTNTHTGPDNPPRVFRRYSPARSNLATSGLCVHLALRRTLLPTASALWKRLLFYRSRTGSPGATSPFEAFPS
jgi:hypothetical protein